MDFGNLDKASQLWQEIVNIDHVVGNFDNGGVIVSMTVSGNGPDATAHRPSATISTIGIPYPPGMTANIRTSLQQRRAAITAELATLGIIGTP